MSTPETVDSKNKVTAINATQRILLKTILGVMVQRASDTTEEVEARFSMADYERFAAENDVFAYLDADKKEVVVEVKPK